ncbi:alpha/beta fold hydrolase [Hymenobacter sp. ASUV-10]|uniref:Alpha/beta fold hydrolase n=1 Tax=Hymenobacter aranciens TaxID=3063996 RepID=A0ABT9B954_9BACT|nr:alpha/beta hydrolase [Hymenobacter sp. ASUV-10]MDO7874697.1 alpha/beta fold hydrolase [Hymenobacter sp. ASUV-10]
MRFFTWAGLVAVALGITTSTAWAQSPRPGPLGGLWKGQLPLLGGKLDMTISIVPLAGGTYFAALDVPAQRVARMAIELTLKEDSVIMWMPQAESRYRARLDTVRKELSGTWTQPGVNAPVVLTHSPMPVAEPGNARLTPPYREEDVVFTNPASRLKLAGQLTIPAGPGPFPAVVLLSDMGPQDRDGSVGDYRLLGSLGDYLTRRGIAVLRFDDRGVGESEGNNATTTIAARVTDAQAALNFLRTRLEVKINQIGIIGHGEGANVALLAAGQTLPPAFVVSLAGYGLPGQQTLLQQQVDRLKAQTTPKLDPLKIQEAYERQRTMYDIIRQTSPQQAQAIVANMLRQDSGELDAPAAQKKAAELLTPWQRHFLAFDPIASLDQVKCPVLLLGGTNDQEAPADLHLTALEKELKSFNHGATSKRLPGVNHLMQPPQTEWTMLNGQMRPVFSPVALEAIREWIVGLYAKK